MAWRSRITRWRWVRRVLAFLAVASVVSFTAGEIALRHEIQVAAGDSIIRARARFDELDVSVGSPSVLYGLLINGRLEEIRMKIGRIEGHPTALGMSLSELARHGYASKDLSVDDIDITIDAVELDRSALLAHRHLVVTSLENAAFKASISQTTLSSITDAELEITPVNAFASIRGRRYEVKPVVIEYTQRRNKWERTQRWFQRTMRALKLKPPIPGIEFETFPLPPRTYLPCELSFELRDDGLDFSCSFDEVPEVALPATDSAETGPSE